eukprot:TRINITY_DN73_c0_g1_i1.p1 TRINITY_DN73_c0_g1~~TRINITY_DN73_c0_g1_i1.p1  ORF type:complete len:802 (-),score=115.58 TRINITY_DN73_c0_g1_i1:597-2969(-)
MNVFQCILGLLFVGHVCGEGMTWDFLDWAQTDVDKHSILSPMGVVIDGVEYSARYNELMRSGDVDPGNSGEVLGQLYDNLGNALQGNTEEGTRNANWKMISNNPDFASILQVGDDLYSVVHFETPLPSAVYALKLNQAVTGELSVDSFFYLNASKYDGIWNPCAGSVSPWNTHLGSEEYSPNALILEDSDSLEEFLNRDDFIGQKVLKQMKYYGLYPKWVNIHNMRELFKPYLFGYPFEVTFSADGRTYDIVKHMAMGRLSIELVKVMPDNKTVYITSDGSNKPFLMFKATTPGDLSRGELFAAHFTQIDNIGGGQFSIDWISLGYAEEEEIFANARSTKFFDMFEFLQPMMSLYPENGGCPTGYTSINSNIAHECLKVKPGMEVLASRFETERYAAMMGATTEFSKWEGITYSAYDNKVYTSLSVIRQGMEDFMSKGKPSESYDKGGNNDIRLEYNPCGCVYQIDVDEEYIATHMIEFICGLQQEPSDINNGDELENECRVDMVAGPDNVAAVEGRAGLIIGEDSDGHQNNIMWYYDLEKRTLSRILSGPYGSEITGVYFHPNINGFSYMLAQVQHPYGDRDQDKLYEEGSFGRDAVIGYFGPFPATTQTPATNAQLVEPITTQKEAVDSIPALKTVDDKVPVPQLQGEPIAEIAEAAQKAAQLYNGNADLAIPSLVEYAAQLQSLNSLPYGTENGALVNGVTSDESDVINSTNSDIDSQVNNVVQNGRSIDSANVDEYVLIDQATMVSVPISEEQSESDGEPVQTSRQGDEDYLSMLTYLQEKLAGGK